MNIHDFLEDAIFASPLGSTTPWRCIGCDTPISHQGQPCKCMPDPKPDPGHTHDFYWVRGKRLCVHCFRTPDDILEDAPTQRKLP
jgi:hypothetical protein